LVETLQWARPTLFLAVPRVWEKFEDKLKEIASTKPGIV
jgi:long-subunit acyl-CoA synthetase (AMP-forming)